MSLTASMWTSVSGLLAHGEKMNVIGNNIANVNTVAFKGSRMDFQDYVHQTVYSATGPSQIGRGVAIGAILGDFSQGSFESSTNPTDMGIHGNGFFKVRPKNTTDNYFTRAGNFRFDYDGYLVDPNGYVLQGWQIEQAEANMGTSSSSGVSGSNSNIKGSGVPVDIRLATFSCDPKHTSNITAGVNLVSDMGAEKAHVDPSLGSNLAALFHNWDATPDATTLKIPPPLGNDGYAWPYSTTVYDESGASHVITIYFDKVDQDVDNIAAGEQIWEYIVTMDPADDNRMFGTDAVPADKKGILMTGTLTFNSTGNMTDMSAFVPTKGGSGAGGFDDLNTWVAAPISSNGYPMFSANFTGRPDASNVWDSANLPSDSAPGLINSNTRGYLTELNLGMRCTSNWWTIDAANTGATFGAMGKDAAKLPSMDRYGERQQNASTAYANSTFREIHGTQDGYSYGSLSNIHVTQDGIVTGRYSNGVTLELFQITLFDFHSPHNLYRVGGNLFSATKESGDPMSGAANSGGMGAVYSNQLEMSNVDLAREFVNMITTQRGFQANSKGITTTDTMLETVINMKR